MDMSKISMLLNIQFIIHLHQPQADTVCLPISGLANESVYTCATTVTEAVHSLIRSELQKTRLHRILPTVLYVQGHDKWDGFDSLYKCT